MSDLKRIGALEVGQDTNFQRYQWTAQRFGWGFIALVLVAALLGLTGNGPLSRAAKESADHSIRVDYHRFLRVRSPARLVITLAPADSVDGTVRLWLDRAFLKGVQIKQVTPLPEKEEVGSDRHVFVFRLASPGEPTEIVFHFEPDDAGNRTCRLGRVDGAEVSFGQFVYP